MSTFTYALIPLFEISFPPITTGGIEDGGTRYEQVGDVTGVLVRFNYASRWVKG